MSFSNYADHFYNSYKRERVIASRPNALSGSYRQPDRDRVSDGVLAGPDGTQSIDQTTATTTPGTPSVVTGPSLMAAIQNNKLMALGAVGAIFYMVSRMGR